MKCGKQIARVVKTQPERGDFHVDKKHNRAKGKARKEAMRRDLRGDDFREQWQPPDTLDWRPTCACGHTGPIGCTVLDPFSGTGTTGAAALELGHNYIGIDLSAKYHEIARRRLGEVSPLFQEVE